MASATLVNSNIVLVRPRIPVDIGTLDAVEHAVQFGVGDGTRLTIVVPTGTVTTTLLECSIDGGATWFTIPPITTDNYTVAATITNDTAPSYAKRFDITALSGAQFRFAVLTGTITASHVWVMAGVDGN